MNLDHLRTYLQDHMAGAVGLIDMAERSRDNCDDPALRATFTRLIDQIEQDRRELERLIETVGGERSTLKEIGARTMERLAALKLGGLGGRSPMSRLQEFESMVLGVRGKKLLWERMGELKGGAAQGLLASFDFARLERRADEQIAELEELHSQAASRVLVESA